MLTSKELLKRTGISRATLNNYIALGLLPRPIVKRGGDAQGRAPRLGYFPVDAVQRIEEVQRLKYEGLSMANIAARFRGAEGSKDREPEARPEPAPGSEPGSAPESEPESRSESRSESVAESGLKTAPGADLRVTISDIPGPAYMVNNNFELVWWNERAARGLFGLSGGMQGEVEARNVFRLLMLADPLKGAPDREEVVAFHLGLAKKRLPREALTRMYTAVSSRDARILDELYDSTEPIAQRSLTHRYVNLAEASGEVGPYNLYACYFREGILFAYVPVAADSESLIELLARREQVIRDLLKRRMPFLTNVAVLVADLQNSVQICAELPPEEYFALINHIWQGAEPVFRKYYGTHGKHVGDGMVHYFFPQPDCNHVLNAVYCAHELKDMMREVSREWQARKNWLNELHLNSGLNEGREWFGTYHSDTNIEFTVLGDTINHAARISDFARLGSIWVTKNMLGTLTPQERDKVRFGIRRRTEGGEEVFVSNLYARISSMVDLSEGRHLKFRDIATLAVAEVVDVRREDRAPPALPGFPNTDVASGAGQTSSWRR